MTRAELSEASRGPFITVLILLACAVALCVGLVGPAGATAIYSSAAGSTFTLIPFESVSSITDHAPFTSTSTTGIGAAAIGTFTASGLGVHPATIESSVSGSAAAPPTSSSFAEAKRGHVFVIPRITAEGPLPTLVVGFSFEIHWETHLAVGVPGSEFATGGAFFAISGFEEGIDAIALDPGMPGSLVLHGAELAWEYNPNYGTGLAPVDEIHSTIITGSITVLSGMVGEFSVITDTAGFAGARAVSAPMSILLLAPSLVWLAWRSRRSGGSPS
jgi:hypothetical protein